MQTDKENDFIDDIESKFLGQVAGQEKRKAARKVASTDIAERKSQKLVPMRKLLQRLVNRGLIVHHCERGLSSGKAPQAFSVYENESSDSLLPGMSIFIEHPAQIEIAIPNDTDVPRLGEIVIMCATQHPDRAILQGPFRSIRDAALALSDFLARNTVDIERVQ